MFLLKDRCVFEVAVALTMTWEFALKEKGIMYFEYSYDACDY